MSIVRRVAASTATQIAGRVAIALIGVASIAVLTRYLGAEDYGRYTLALSFVAAFGAVADAGLFSILVRDISRSPERTEELVGNAITLRAVLWLVVSAAAVLVGLALPYEPQVRIAIVIAAVPFGFGLLNAALVSMFQARLRMLGPTIADVIGRAAAFGAAVTVVALDLGFYLALAAVGVGGLVTLALTTAFARREIRLRPRADTAVWRALLTASLPIGLALALNELYLRLDQLVISLSRPVVEVGWYGLAFRVTELGGTFAGALLVSVFSVLAVQVAARDPALRRTIQAANDVYVAAGVPLALGGLVLAPHVIRAVAGEEFLGGADALRILLFATALGFVNALFGYALIAADRQRETLWLNVTALLLNVALNVALVPPFGLNAAAATSVAGEVVILAGCWWLMRRHLGLFPGPQMLVRAVPAAGAMALVLWALDDLPLAALLPVALGVYLVALAGLGGVSLLARTVRSVSAG